MSYEEPLYSNRNGVMLLEGLPSDLLPGAALAVAFRAGKSPKVDVKVGVIYSDANACSFAQSQI